MSVFAPLLARQQVEWRTADGGVRFHLRTVTVLDDIRRSALLEAGRVWLTSELGVDLEAFVAETKQSELSRRDVEIYHAMQRVADWASIVVAIERLETQADGGKWEAVPVPDAWFTFDGFAAEVPGDLFARLVRASHELNPLLWHVPMDDEAKKNASTSANGSKRSSSASSAKKTPA